MPVSDPFTQPNRNAHILATQHRAAHNLGAQRCAGSVGWNLPRQRCRLAQHWVLSSRSWANVSSTYIAARLVRLSRGLPIQLRHITEPAHHWAAGLCAARRYAAMLCAIRLDCVERHPCYPFRQNSIMHRAGVTWNYSCIYIIEVYNHRLQQLPCLINQLWMTGTEGHPSAP